MATHDDHYGAIGASWEDKLALPPLLFSDDPLAPLDFLDAHRRQNYDEPEKKLLSALLRDAVFCFQHYLNAPKRSSRKLQSAAEQWIFDADSDDVYSFNSVCEHLGIAPDYLRRGLRRWKLEQIENFETLATSAMRAVRTGPRLETPGNA